MKEVCAIIRINRINETKRALAEAGIPAMTARKALGRGRGQVEYLLQPGPDQAAVSAGNSAETGAKLFPKRVLNIMAPDAAIPKIVETILRVNHTGRPGDGRIFVMPLLDAVRVRTGETGDTALDEQT